MKLRISWTETFDCYGEIEIPGANPSALGVKLDGAFITEKTLRNLLLKLGLDSLPAPWRLKDQQRLREHREILDVEVKK